MLSDSLAFTVADFLDTFGAPPEDAALIANEVGKYDFRYRRLSQAERDAVILRVLRRLDGFTQVGEHRKDIWEMSWADTAARYDAAGEEIDALEPSFIGGTKEIRLRGDYAVPVAPKFEFNWFRVLRLWLFRRYISGAPQVYEFGCGSGFNLVAMARLAPEARFVGLDWAESAVALINRVAAKHALSLSGRRFDFFHPDPDLKLEPGSVVTTFCALEQTGERCGAFVDWLMTRRPRLVVSMEPIVDFYDPESLFDDMVLRYHGHRQYLSGYLGRIKALSESGRCELVAARRLFMGSLYHEGYSLLIWKPLG
jgi:SAM-dependent methyltransferase